MIAMLLLAAALLSVARPAAAVEVPSLYPVQVPLAPNDPDARSEAYDRALAQVVVRINGTRDALAPGELETLFPEGVSIDLLKCDIEGSELELLESYGDLLRRVEIAVIELHHEICDTARCYELLRAAGFAGEERLREDDRVSVALFWR